MVGFPLSSWSLWLRLENAAGLAAFCCIYGLSGYNWWVFAALLLVPDLSMLGYLLGRRVGAVAYNLGHSYAGPALITCGAAIHWGEAALPYALIWAAHISLDRMLGYGLKSFDGFRFTHLGTVGRAKMTGRPPDGATT
ncbi:MAG: DUF4260 domain-containing protein [Pseudomonadota bacterium]